MPFDVYIAPGNFKPALFAALLSVSLLIALFAYLNVYTRRRYFNLWMVAWMFYALWLTLIYHFESHHSPFLAMASNWSVGISAVFLFWGSLMFMGRRVKQRLLALVMVFLFVWSYVGAYHLDDPLQARIPIFSMMGLASILAGRCFFVYRLRKTFAGATLLCAGFVLWGIFLIAYPFVELLTDLGATIFVLAALLQLFIGISMIILVLEEARLGRTSALGRIATERAVRRDLEQKVRASEARFRRLFEQASDAIVIATPKHFKILELNTRARALLGLHEDLVDNVSLTSFLDRTVPTQARDTQKLDKLLQGAPLNLIGRDGRHNAVTVERTSIEMDGESLFQFVFKEFTERSQLEQQVRQADKLSALGQMISGVAHELNNPLAIIKGYLDLIQHRSDIPSPVRDDLRKVAHESNRAAKLVRSFLSFARQQPAQRTAMDINALIESLVEIHRFDSLVAQADITLNLEPRVSHVVADADQIQQVLVNLVQNAIHAIVSTSAAGKIVISSEQTQPDKVVVRVEDSGPGVPAELRAKIFEPFYTTKETGAGTGLGLSIAHSIILEHGGRIFCGQSRLGGACFTVEFPRAEVVAAPVSSVTPVEFVAERTGRILVLDDEETLAEMVGQMLSCYGHDVTISCTPGHALDLIRKHSFDVVVSDYRMPLLDGREFHSRVRQMNGELAGRIIFLTGDVVSEETRAFFQCVGNPRLTKPFHLETVARAVNDMLLQRAA